MLISTKIQMLLLIVQMDTQLKCKQGKETKTGYWRSSSLGDHERAKCIIYHSPPITDELLLSGVNHRH